jgi:hypothetical protein
MRGFFYAGNFLAVLYPQMNADKHACFMLSAATTSLAIILKYRISARTAVVIFAFFAFLRINYFLNICV